MDKALSPSQKRKKYYKPAVITFTLLVFFVLLYTLVLKNLTTISANLNDITTAKASVMDLEISFTVDAKVTPQVIYQVESSVGGKIESLKLKAGDQVQKGDVILILSNDDMKMELLSQETAVLDQENNLYTAKVQSNQSRLTHKRELAQYLQEITKAKRVYRKNQELYNKKYLSEEEFLDCKEDLSLLEQKYQYTIEEAKTDSLSREAQIEQSEQSLKHIKLTLVQMRNKIQSLTVKAPISGVITDLDLLEGQFVNIGSKIAIIEDSTKFYLRASVDEYYLPRLKSGARAKMNFNEQNYWLNVAKISPKLSNGGVQVDFAGDLPANLKSGQNVSLDIIGSVKKNALTIPTGQYLTDTNSNWVYVVNKERNKAIKRNVKIGDGNLKEVTILSGLNEGEEIIVSSYEKWLNKSQINLK